MRPIDRGDAPKEYDDYRDAKEDLVSRLGLFCSYCERPIKTNLAVEHVLPKSRYPQFETDWTNFVLGCVNCNSTKLNRDVNRELFVLPDQDNSFRAFVYTKFGEILPDEELEEEVYEKAEQTLSLTGLDKFPDEFLENEPELFEAALERWQQRSDAWKTAELAHSWLQQSDNPEMRSAIGELANATGFFSIWMQVFDGDVELRRRFIESFPGTSNDCFDPDTVPLPRPNGHC